MTGSNSTTFIDQTPGHSPAKVVRYQNFCYIFFCSNVHMQAWDCSNGGQLKRSQRLSKDVSINQQELKDDNFEVFEKLLFVIAIQH